MFSHKKVDATKGPILPTMLKYALPLMLTTLIQGLFNAVDIAVLGNMASPTDVASVGATSTIATFLVNLFIGISSGVKILIARYIGSGNRRKAQDTVNTAIISSVGFGLIVAILGFFVAPAFLNITKCPADCYQGALIYLRIYICGAPAIMLYNFASSIITSAGDTQRPLYYMLAGGALNVTLNIVLCLLLPQKVAAVAIATIASQLLGACLCVRRLCKLDGICRLHPKLMRWNPSSFGLILRMGLPLAISSVLYPLANLQIQTARNSFGSFAIAGHSSATHLDCVVSAINGAFATSTNVFIGQNLGAGKHDRVKKSIRHAFWMSVTGCTVIGIFMFLTGNFWMGLLVGFENTDAIYYGRIYMFFVTAFYGVAAANGVLGHAIQSFGYPTVSSFTSIFCILGFRVVWMQWIYPAFPTYTNLNLCYTVSWVLLLLSNIVLFTVFYRRYLHGKYKKL